MRCLKTKNCSRKMILFAVLNFVLSIACSFVQVPLFWLLDQCLDSMHVITNIIKFRYRQACDLRVGRFLGSIIYFFAILLHLLLFILSHFIFRIFPTTLCTKFFSNLETERHFSCVRHQRNEKSKLDFTLSDRFQSI